jgi:hypothetical protein
LEVYSTCDSSHIDQWTATFAPGLRFDFTANNTGPIFLRLSNYPASVAGTRVRYQVAVNTIDIISISSK